MTESQECPANSEMNHQNCWVAISWAQRQIQTSRAYFQFFIESWLGYQRLKDSALVSGIVDHTKLLKLLATAKLFPTDKDQAIGRREVGRTMCWLIWTIPISFAQAFSCGWYWISGFAYKFNVTNILPHAVQPDLGDLFAAWSIRPKPRQAEMINNCSTVDLLKQKRWLNLKLCRRIRVACIGEGICGCTKWRSQRWTGIANLNARYREKSSPAHWTSRFAKTNSRWRN